MKVQFDWSKIQKATHGKLKKTSTGFEYMKEGEKEEAFEELERRISGYLEKAEDAPDFLDR